MARTELSPGGYPMGARSAFAAKDPVPAPETYRRLLVKESRVVQVLTAGSRITQRVSEDSRVTQLVSFSSRLG